MGSKINLTIGSLVLAGVVLGAAPTFASDSLQAGVTIPADQPQPVITENGTGYTPGTYAVGVVRLTYTYIGTTFPVGPFAAFNLNVGVYNTGKGQATSYPVALALTDIGSANLTLSPATSPLQVSGPAWTGSVPVTISIPSAVAADPLLNVDGAVLVGNFKLDAGNDLKTDTNVQVKITLVHPTACLKVYGFITDAALTNTITSTEIGINKNGKVTATNPYGSLAENLMVVNTCGTAELFDAKLSLDAAFLTQPNNNPGNAVFTFSTSGEIDPASFAIAAFGVGTPQGQSLCLSNVSVPAASTFLASVHMSINNGMAAASLPGGGVGPGTFTGFGGALYTAGSACSAAPLSSPSPNPLSIPWRSRSSNVTSLARWSRPPGERTSLSHRQHCHFRAPELLSQSVWRFGSPGGVTIDVIAAVSTEVSGGRNRSGPRASLQNCSVRAKPVIARRNGFVGLCPVPAQVIPRAEK